MSATDDKTETEFRAENEHQVTRSDTGSSIMIRITRGTDVRSQEVIEIKEKDEDHESAKAQVEDVVGEFDTLEELAQRLRNIKTTRDE